MPLLGELQLATTLSLPNTADDPETQAALTYWPDDGLEQALVNVFDPRVVELPLEQIVDVKYPLAGEEHTLCTVLLPKELTLP